MTTAERALAADQTLRDELEETLRELEADVAFYTSRRVATIAEAPTPESAMAGAAVWDTLIGERQYAIGLIRGVLRRVPEPVRVIELGNVTQEDFEHLRRQWHHEAQADREVAADNAWGAGEAVEASRG